MAEYVIFNSNTKNGELGISYRVFDSLVTSTLANIKGIARSSKHLKKNQYFRLNRPVQTRIVRDIVHILIFVDVVKDNNIATVVSKIQEEVTNSLMLITEQVPVNIQVKVESFI